MTIKNFILVLLLFSKFCSVAQEKQKLFESSYTMLNNMIENDSKYSFKKAVFAVENAYLDGNLDTLWINKQIKLLNNLSKSLIKDRFLAYLERDKEKVNKWASVFEVVNRQQKVD